MTIRQVFRFAFGVVFLLLLTLAALTAMLFQTQIRLWHGVHERDELQALARELRQSSEDLTRFARLYAATGDPRYEAIFRDVLAIRNGEKPRPVGYSPSYWTYYIADGKAGADGEKKALLQMMAEKGFSSEELGRLEQAHSDSERLVRIEETAIHAVKGEFDDGTGQFTRRGAPDRDMALALLHGTEYHREKARIMRSVDQCYDMLARRTEAAVEGAEDRAEALLTAVIVTVLIGILIAGVIFVIGSRRVLRPIDMLQAQTRAVARDVERLGEVAEAIRDGRDDARFVSEAAPLGLTAPDEMGDLAREHDEMIADLQKTGAAIAEITAELQKRTAQSAEAEMRTRLVLESVNDGICGTDDSGRIIFINNAGLEMFGYTREACLGKEIHPLVHHSHPDGTPYPREQCPMYAAMVSGETRRVDDEVFWRADGTHFPAEYCAAPMLDAEKRNVGMVLVYRDITERRAAEEKLARQAIELERAKQAAEAATQAKSEFLANMSHEIRTPMNGVLGMVHLALRTDLTLRQRDYLQKIQRSGEQLLAIINDILDFSKVEAGKMRLEAIDFELDDVLENLGSLVAPKAFEKGLEFLFDAGKGIPPVLRGDPLRLGQVLINLANNAVKFTEKGSVVVRVEQIEEADGEVILRFAVRDTGIGLSQEQRDRLFQAFSQADTSTTRKYGGTGLGLVICSRLVELMHGTIRVDSVPGQGSEFSFTARFEISDKPRARKRVLDASQFRLLRVLVVDDAEMAREVLAEMVASMHAEAVAVSSGRAAIAALEEAERAGRPFGIVLLDWRMPEMDGFETARRIREDAALKSSPHIIMVSAYGREDLFQQVKELDLNGPLLKPVSPSMLFDALVGALGGADGERVEAPAPRKAVRLPGVRLLLVEDNPINQQIAREILEGAGAEVVVADNGALGVKAVEREPFDGVLMDVQMPVMDGYQATAAIRAHERFKELPIIAMTAHAMSGDRELCLAAGMNDYVTKPIQPDLVLETISRWVKAEVGVEVARPDVAETDLPEIAGVDVADGLRRVGGNRTLYFKLLGDFARQQRGVEQQVREAMARGDVETATRDAHTLKGTAGNLGMSALFAAGERLEGALRQGAPFEGPLADAMARLAEVLDAVDALPAPAQAPAVAAAGTFEAEAALEHLAALREMLEVGDPGAVDRLSQLEGACGGASAESLAEIRQFLDEFEFEKAAEVAQRLDAEWRKT